jgi:alpha-amylase
MLRRIPVLPIPTSAICIALACAFAIACSSDDSLTDPNAPMGLAITVQPSAVTIAVSDTVTAADASRLTLEATSLGKPVTTPRAEWTSSNPSVATVDSTGNVRAIAFGTATITARVNGAKATTTVTVTQRVAAVKLSPSSLLGLVGDTITVTASAVDVAGVLVPGTAYAFSSLDATTTSVTRTGNRTARVLLLKAGAIGVAVAAGGRAATATGTAAAP